MKQRVKPDYKEIERAWTLVRDASIDEAKAMSKELVEDVRDYVELMRRDNKPVLAFFAHACHLAGYTASMTARDNETETAIKYFVLMEHAARDLGDDTLLVIALTYQGDAYRRAAVKGSAQYGKDLEKARECLQMAYEYTSSFDLTDPDARAALGNCAQLLARVHLRQGEIQHFREMMRQAEEIAGTINQVENSLHGQYCLGTVYIDYVRYYIQQGQTQKALVYLSLAEAELPSTPHWKTLLTATRGIALVKSGDLEAGMLYVTKAIQLGREHGNRRMIDRFHELKSFLDHRVVEWSKANALLSHALHEAEEQ